MIITQQRKFSRLLLAASVSIASVGMVACGNDNNNGDTNQNEQTTSAPYYLASYRDSITPTKAVSWEVTDHDERVRKMEVNGDKLVVLNRWYNGIVQVPTDSSDVTASPVGFAALTTAGHHVESTDEDYISGASEHLLLDAWYNDDNTAMYALVNKPRTTVTEDDTYGLFKVPLNADGSIPSRQIKGKTVYHREAGVVRVGDGMSDDDLKLTDALPLTNGNILAFDENHNAVAVYSSDLVLDETNSFALAEGSKIVEWVANANGVYLLVKDTAGKLSLEKRNLDNLKKVANSVGVDAASYLETNKNSDYVAVAGANVVKLFDADLQVAKTFSLTSKASGMSLSTDGERLALSTEKEGELVLIDIAQKIPAMTSVETGEDFRTFTLGDKQTVFLSTKSGQVQKIALTGQPTALNANELLQVALDNVTAESLNHGYDASAVRYDLALPTNKNGGLPNVSYVWTSNNSAIDSATGTINRPAAGSAPVVTTLTLTATSTVDGTSVEGSKTFELSVLPQVNELGYNQEIKIKNATEDQNFRVMAANTAGSRLAAFARKEGKVLVIDTATNTQDLVVLPESFNKADSPSMLWKDDNTLIVVANDNTGVGALLSLDTVNKTWSTLKTLDAKVYTAVPAEDNSTISIETVASKKYHLTTYQLSDMSEVSSYDLTGRLRRFVTDSRGEVAYTSGYERGDNGYIYKLVRYNKGIEDANIEVAGYAYSFTKSNNKLVLGDSKGNFSVVDNAFAANAPQANSVITTYTARNDYDGTNYSNDHHHGRTYSIAATGDIVITMYRDVGLSTYKFNGSQYVEDSFVADDGIYRFVAAGNKSKVFTYNRDTQTFNVLNIQ